jgi:hypothetical protein
MLFSWVLPLSFYLINRTLYRFLYLADGLVRPAPVFKAPVTRNHAGCFLYTALDEVAGTIGR